MPTRLSTDDIALRDRPAYWNYLVSSVLGRLNTTPQRKGEFNGEIAYSHLSTIPIAQVASSQLHVQRQEKFVDRPNEDFYKVNFQLEGQATLTQNGRTAILEPGNWVIYDNTRPYDLHFHDDYRQLLFLVPRNQLLTRLPTIDLFLAQSLSSQRGMGKLLFGFVANTLQESDEISAETQPQTAQMLLDMLLLGVTDSAETPIALPGSTHFVQLQQIVATHLHNPDLSVETLASHSHLSTRHIQKLFAAKDTTVNRYIWEQRIMRCKIDLGDPRMFNTPIQDIAMAWGYRSSAHFSRQFKRATDMSPSAFRQQAIDAFSQ